MQYNYHNYSLVFVIIVVNKGYCQKMKKDLINVVTHKL